METLYKIKKFCNDNNVEIDIDFCRFGVKILMSLDGLCRSLTLHDDELLYDKVDICVGLEEMLKELKKLKKKEEENEL